MKPILNFVQLANIPILQQLQWEEALLRADQENWCLINQGSPPAIVLGISGQVSQMIATDKLKQSPVPLIRRFSGGGTVIVDENTLFVTLICQSEALPVTPFPRPLMQWTADHLYRPLFPDPLFQLHENDYTLDGRKWGGNAQSILKGRWLHHSSLLWDYREEHMEYLLMPPKTPVYRQGRAHQDFLCKLRDYWPHSQPQSFQEKILAQLNQFFQITEQTETKLDLIANLPHRKAAHLIPLISD